MRNARMTIWVRRALIMVLCICWQEGMADIVFDDGGMHDIAYFTIEHIDVFNESFWDDATTVNLIEGGSIKTIDLFEDSIFNIDGGVVNDSVSIKNNSQVFFNSGQITGEVHLEENCYFEMNGGSLIDDSSLWMQDNSNVIINGGNIQLDISIGHNSTLTITGGVISGYLNGGQTAKINIHGGIFDSPIHFGDSAQTTIYGSDFYINGVPAPYGSYSGDRSGVITGLLSDGTVLNHDLDMYTNATLTLVYDPVPEPTTLLLLGLGAVMLRRKYRA